MKTFTAGGALTLAALAFPASALAHDASATVSCTGATIDFVQFAAGSNTVDYRVSVDGVATFQGRYRLDATGGRTGRLVLPFSLHDAHRVVATAWWGPGDIQDRHVRAANAPALADGVVDCPATPPVIVPPVTPPVAPPVTPPVAPPVVVPPPAGGGVLGVTAISPVKSKSARADAKCVSMPKSLSVRARELTSVRVRVKADGKSPAGAVVRITGPGFVKKLTTNAEGIAIFRIRARRSGTLVIQSDRCLGADRVAVKSARRVASQRVPRVTG